MITIDIPEKVIEFEDGKRVDVPAFRVTPDCVSVKALLEFQRDTQYITLSERKGYKTFLDNELVSHLAEHELMSQPAYCISSLDAAAFCDWNSCRLPSEAEWLSASLVDTNVYESRRSCPLCDERGRIKIEELEGQICFSSGFELTATWIGESVVIRSGPRYFRDVGWQLDINENRQFIKPNEVDLMVAFRTCPLS